MVLLDVFVQDGGRLTRIFTHQGEETWQNLIQNSENQSAIFYNKKPKIIKIVKIFKTKTDEVYVFVIDDVHSHLKQIMPFEFSNFFDYYLLKKSQFPIHHPQISRNHKLNQ